MIPALVLLATSAATASAATIVYFHTPSRNMGCAYFPVISTGDVPSLRREIRSGVRGPCHHAREDAAMPSGDRRSP